MINSLFRQASFGPRKMSDAVETPRREIKTETKAEAIMTISKETSDKKVSF